MTRLKNALRERGAVLIHVTIAMLGLLAFSALVVDYGIFWVARRQAQNSADAGALAGAMSLAFDDPKDFSDDGPAKRTAHAAALANKVFGGDVNVNITTDITFPPCPDDNADTCIKVDVYRNNERGNPLPTFFARLLGITSQDMKATATAKVLHGNATQCMRPFGILDKWDEWNENDTGSEVEFEKGVLDNDWNYLDSTYDVYDDKSPEFGNDTYEPVQCSDPEDADTCVPGTGFRMYDDAGEPLDYGRQIQIKTGSQDQTSAGWFQPLQLKPGDDGAKDFCNNIKYCSGVTNMINQTVETENGNMVGPTDQCLWTDADSLYNQDPTAKWVVNEDYPNGAVISEDYPSPNSSPRIIPLPVINPDEFFASDPNGHTEVVIRNIFGFFIESTVGQGGHTQTVGRILTVPGLYVGGNVVDPTSSFIVQIVLIR